MHLDYQLVAGEGGAFGLLMGRGDNGLGAIRIRILLM